MKFICLGYYDEQQWETIPAARQQAMMDECFDYDDVLRAGGHFAGGEGLQGADTAKTLRYRDGRVVITDGPFTETKEILGGILILEARDMQHALELMSKHPGIKNGPFEIRPAMDLASIVEESARRRAATKAKAAK